MNIRNFGGELISTTQNIQERDEHDILSQSKKVEMDPEFGNS